MGVEERRDSKRPDGEKRKGKVVGEEREAAGSAALIKLAEDNEPVCWLACLAV